MVEYLHRYSLTEEEGEYQVLMDLKKIFASHLKENKELGLPKPGDIGNFQRQTWMKMRTT